MIGPICILLPLVVAAAQRFVPFGGWLSLGAAVIDLVLAGSLPWTGTGLNGWLLPEPLVVHGLILTGFAWVMACAHGVKSTQGEPFAPVLVGLLNLALLSDGVGLTILAAGGAGLAALARLRPALPGPIFASAAAGIGLALFGTVVLYAGNAPTLGPGWQALSWSALQQAGPHATGMALSAGFVLILLGLGIICCLVPLTAAWNGLALPPDLTMLAGPLGGTWLVMVLRLRGVLDGNGHAIAPGRVMMLSGLMGLAVSMACLARRGDGIVASALLAVLAVTLVGFGVGGAAATAAALLHLTLGCLALTACAGGSRLGLASLAGMPPLGVFASGFALLAAAAERSVPVAALLGLSLFGVATLTLQALSPAATANRLSWLGAIVTLAAAWAMPPGITGWIQGIAAAAR